MWQLRFVDARAEDVNMSAELEKVNIIISSGDYQQAFLKLMELNQQESAPALLCKMAEIMEKMQNFAMSAVYYEQLLTKFPHSDYEERAKNILSRYYIDYDDHDLFTLNADADSFLEKGLQELQAGDLHRAILMFKKGILQHSAHYLLNFYLGQAYYDYYCRFGQSQARYLDLALSSFLNAARVNPSAKVFHNMACIFAELGDGVMAANYFQRAITMADTPALKAYMVANERNFLLRTDAREYRFLQEMIQ